MQRSTNPGRVALALITVAICGVAVAACASSTKQATGSAVPSIVPASSPTVATSLLLTSTPPAKSAITAPDTTQMGDSEMDSTGSAPAPSSPATGIPGSAPATSDLSTSSATPPSTASGAKCTDLTAAAASAAIGKPTTVKADPSVAPLAGLSICNLTIAGGVYPIQLTVNTSGAATEFQVDEQVSDPVVALSGVGEKAFTSDLGVEAISGSVVIKVIGPAGPVLDKDFKIPTAIAKAMVAALK